MSKHTPGPFQALPIKNDRLNRWHIIETSSPGIGKWVIATGIRTEANARLLAAAPELLDALQAIVKSLADQDDEGMIEHAQQMIDARAAITKAMGEA